MGRAIVLLLLLVLGLVMAPTLVAAYSVSTGPYTGDEVRDTNYFLGSLTWRSGKGGIAWAPSPESEDPAGPPKDVAADQAQYVGYQTRQPTRPPTVVDFVSDPLPRTLYINESRTIQVDLMVVQPGDTAGPNGNPCSYSGTQSGGGGSPDVRLLLGDVLVAGAPTASSMYLYTYPGTYSQNFYTAPPGYAACRYRMPTEASVLPVGSVLTLRVTIPVDAFRIYQYGAASDHRSVVRLPYYPEEEVFYRYPDVSSLHDGGGEDASVSGAVLGWGAGALGSLAGAVRVGRRRVPTNLLLVGVLLLVGFAGCLAHDSAGTGLDGSNPGGPKGGATSTIQPLGGDSELARSALGAVWGLVHDDLNVPLERAHVSLIGTGNYTESDAAGRFKLNNLSPGAYRLRVDRLDYRSLETPVQVVANNITRVDVTMVPLEAREGDARPHHHDYWAGAATVPVFDGPLGQTCTSGYACIPATTFRLQPTSGSTPNTIRPGTREVEVTITYDKAQIGFDRIGLYVQANHDPGLVGRYPPENVTLYYPRESPATFHVATNWEMADVGHQPYSTWSFGLWAPSRDQHNSIYESGYYSGLTKQVSSTSAPQFAAKIVLHKGTVPLERAHPDHWGPSPSLIAAKGTKAGPSSATVLVTDAIFGIGFLSYCAAQTWLNYAWTPTLVVPQGTTWVEVVVKQNRETGMAGVGHYDWVLWYQPGNVPPKTFVFPTADQPTSNPSYKPAGAFQASEGNTNYTWRLPLKPEEADSFYNVKSNWAFAMHPTDFKQACIDTRTYVYTNPLATSVLTVAWTVTAHRDPLPT